MKIVRKYTYDYTNNTSLYIEHENMLYELLYKDKVNSCTWIRYSKTNNNKDGDLNYTERTKLGESKIPIKVREFAKKELAKELI